MNYSVESNSRKYENVRRLAHKSQTSKQEQIESSNIINNKLNAFHNNRQTYQVNVIQDSAQSNKNIIRQTDFIHDIPKVTKRKAFDLELAYPTVFEYSLDSFVLNLATKNGSLSMIDLRTYKQIFNIEVADKIHSLKALHDNRLLAVAQRRNIQIQDDRGIEIHNVISMKKIKSMVFLPYFYLLCGVSTNNLIQQLDITNGKVVESIKLDNDILPSSRVTLDQDRQTGMSYVAHTNGTVCSQSPNSKQQVSKLQANDSSLLGVRHQRSKSGIGQVQTLGTNRKLKLFDVRNNQECLREVSLPATPFSFDLSSTGKLAISLFDRIDIFNDLTLGNEVNDYEDCLCQSEIAPSASSICDLKFMNFEDVLGCGHSRGFSSFIVPGSGEKKLDQFEFVNPSVSKKHKENLIIKSLINKLNYKMISDDIDNTGCVDSTLYDQDEQVQQENMDRIANLNKDRSEMKKNIKDGIKRKRHKDQLYDQKIRKEIKERNDKIKKVNNRDQDEEIDMIKLADLEDRGLI